LIWSLSLGSGTSGGVLAPMFMIGAALGALAGTLFPHVVPGFWPLVCLAGVIGGVMRAPFTAVVFSLELTHRWGAILPLLITATAAYLLTSLVLKRSILTEKVARRGFHLTREYDVDPLSVLFVREVMDVDDILVYSAQEPLDPLVQRAVEERHTRTRAQRQRLYPVVDADDLLVGVITRRDLLALMPEFESGQRGRPQTVAEAMTQDSVVAYPDDTLRDVAYRMAETGVTRMPVVLRGEAPKLMGIVTLPALLAGRLRDLQEDREAERIIRLAGLRPRREASPV
jgi:CBS domain-containing protein